MQQEECGKQRAYDLAQRAEPEFLLPNGEGDEQQAPAYDACRPESGDAGLLPEPAGGVIKPDTPKVMPNTKA